MTVYGKIGQLITFDVKSTQKSMRSVELVITVRLNSNTRFIACSRYFYAKIYTNFVLKGKILLHRSV